MPPIPTEGLTLAGASIPFRIIAARYGEENRWVDATRAIRAQVHDPSPFTVHNMVGGRDLHFGVKECLVLWFEMNGRRYARITAEAEVMTLMPG